MRILIKQLDNNNATLYNFADICNILTPFDSIAEWNDNSISVDVYTPSGDKRTENTLVVGDVLRATDSAVDFKRDSDRVDETTDYYALTVTGFMFRVRIETGSNEATVEHFTNSPYSLHNAVDGKFIVRLDGQSQSIVDSGVIEPTTSEMLSETEFPVVKFYIHYAYATGGNGLETGFGKFRVSSGHREKRFIQYRFSDSSSWSTYDGNFIQPFAESVGVSDFRLELQIRYIPTKQDLHQLRREIIYNDPASYLTHSTTVQFLLNVRAVMKNWNDGVYVESLTGDAGFDNLITNPSLNTQDRVKIHNLLMWHAGTAQAANDTMNKDVFFTRPFVPISESSYDPITGLANSVILKEDGGLASDGWWALSNGNIINIQSTTAGLGNRIVDSMMSSYKWTGNELFDAASSPGSVISHTGDYTIHDHSSDAECELPGVTHDMYYNYNNFAEVDIVCSAAVDDLGVQIDNVNNERPDGGLFQLLRDEGETEWNSIYDQFVSVGEFFTRENSPIGLSLARSKTNHQVKLYFRKPRGYIFDAPRGGVLTYDVKVIGKAKVHGLSNAGSFESVITLKIIRPWSRWKSDQIPLQSYDEYTGWDWSSTTNISRFAQIIGGRSRTSSTYAEDLDSHQPAYISSAEQWDLPASDGRYYLTASGKCKYITSDGPYGEQMYILRATATGDNNADGGPILSESNSTIDFDTTHAVVQYIRVNKYVPGDTSVRWYTGCSRYGEYGVNNRSGAPQKNPYFQVITLKDLPVGVWMLNVNYIQKRGSVGTGNIGGGLWRLDNKQKLFNSNDFVFNDKTSFGTRSFMYYSRTPGHQLDWTGLGVYPLKGSIDTTFHEKLLYGFDEPLLSVFENDETTTYPVEGSEQQRGTLKINNITYDYKHGVLYEALEAGYSGNSIAMTTSGGITLPYDSLRGGLNTKTTVPGGSPGPAVFAVNNSTTINNSGQITGDIDLT